MVDESFLKKHNFCDLTSDDADALEELIKNLWKISEFEYEDFEKSLIHIADEEFADDYQEFLKKDILVKSALHMLGAEGKLRKIESILKEKNDPESRIIAIVQLLSDSTSPYMKKLSESIAEDFGKDYFLCLVAESVILLVLSRNLLNEWSQTFKLICDFHPTTALAITNMVGIALRGEHIIADGRGRTHRNFNDAGNTFEDLLDNEESFGQIWIEKHKRLCDALSKEL